MRQNGVRIKIRIINCELENYSSLNCDVFKQVRMADDAMRYSAFTFGGVEYTVSMSVHNGNQLTVQVEEHSSADQWRNTFDANC